MSAKISGVISNNPKLAEFSSQIRLETTPDGLQIQIVDDQSRPMFDSGSAVVKPYMRDILREIGAALTDVENKISLDGHTDRAALRQRRTRLQQLGALGRPRQCLAPRTGGRRHAGRQAGARGRPGFEPACWSRINPLSPVNRRISILVMTREAEERLLGTGRAPVLSPWPTPKRRHDSRRAR